MHEESMHEEGCWVEHAWRGNNYAETRTQPNTLVACLSLGVATLGCKPNHKFESWSLDGANPLVQRWQIRALLAVGYHLHSTRFCHMYNLEDSMVELKHNAQTSKHKHFFFVLESSVSELPKCFSTWFAIICFYFMSYNAQFHES